MSNLILGAVVYNFSFVFQIYGSVKDLEREQMREYKRVWGEFDPERTGYLARKDIVSFFSVSPSRASPLTDTDEMMILAPDGDLRSPRLLPCLLHQVAQIRRLSLAPQPLLRPNPRIPASGHLHPRSCSPHDGYG